MDSITKFVFIAIGICFALAGIILFAKKDDHSTSTIKVSGFEFSTSGSSLVIFVLGVALIVFPFTDLVHKEKTITQSTPFNPSILPQPPRNLNAMSIPLEEYKKIIINEYETTIKLQKKEEENKQLMQKIKYLEAKQAKLNQNYQLDMVSVSWDPNSEPDLAGYILYYGKKPGHYTSSIDVGNVHEYNIEDLEPGIYYYAVTAYDKNGNESSYSNETKIDLTR